MIIKLKLNKYINIESYHETKPITSPPKNPQSKPKNN